MLPKPNNNNNNNNNNGLSIQPTYQPDSFISQELTLPKEKLMWVVSECYPLRVLVSGPQGKLGVCATSMQEKLLPRILSWLAMIGSLAIMAHM